MKRPSIEITYRGGRIVAAYIAIADAAAGRCIASREMAPGVIVDFARGERAIGLEIALPKSVTLAGVNRVLRAVGAEPLRRSDFGPLRVA